MWLKRESFIIYITSGYFRRMLTILFNAADLK